MMAESKTNAMRILDRMKIRYDVHEYPHGDGPVDALTVAQLTGQDPAKVFKTLVTKGHSNNYFVFVLPAGAELDLKKAAKSVGEKSVEMIHVSEINKITGYIRGGCSPVGMKKQFVTVFAEEALTQDTIYVSGGRIGCQIEAAPKELISAVRGNTSDIIRK
ncbi:MAG: Cys-tRNA(Pro) deacylase [Oscillospiraceae bacterium]|nr:Cys-tRNA(Pro) deacylase [Oscillospiraceae bacterium]